MNAAICFKSDNPPPLPGHRFSVEQYHRMGDAGVLTPDDRVELLEGWIVKKMNHKPVHSYVVSTLFQRLDRSLATGFVGRCQLPITLAHSEPEPDIAVVNGCLADFRHRHPTGSDCRLVIEVADTSISRDRAKGLIYAAACVEEYWIVNLVDQCVERMTLPLTSGYSKTEIVAADGSLVIQLGGLNLDVPLAELFDE